MAIRLMLVLHPVGCSRIFIEAEVGLDGELNSDAENERLRDKAMEPFMSPSFKPMPEFDSDESTFINPVRQLLKAWMKKRKD